MKKRNDGSLSPSNLPASSAGRVRARAGRCASSFYEDRVEELAEGAPGEAEHENPSWCSDSTRRPPTPPRWPESRRASTRRPANPVGPASRPVRSASLGETKTSCVARLRAACDKAASMTCCPSGTMPRGGRLAHHRGLRRRGRRHAARMALGPPSGGRGARAPRRPPGRQPRRPAGLPLRGRRAAGARRGRLRARPPFSESRPATVSLERWHPVEQDWRDLRSAARTADDPAEHRAPAAARGLELASGHAEWEVRVPLPNRDATDALAEQLQAEGLPVVKRSTFPPRRRREPRRRRGARRTASRRVPAGCEGRGRARRRHGLGGHAAQPVCRVRRPRGLDSSAPSARLLLSSWVREERRLTMDVVPVCRLRGPDGFF